MAYSRSPNSKRSELGSSVTASTSQNGLLPGMGLGDDGRSATEEDETVSIPFSSVGQ